MCEHICPCMGERNMCMTINFEGTCVCFFMCVHTPTDAHCHVSTYKNVSVMVTCKALRTHAYSNVCIEWYIDTCMLVCVFLLKPARNFDVALMLEMWIVHVWSMCMYVHARVCSMDLYVLLSIFPANCMYMHWRVSLFVYRSICLHLDMYIYIYIMTWHRR